MAGKKSNLPKTFIVYVDFIGCRLFVCRDGESCTRIRSKAGLFSRKKANKIRNKMLNSPGVGSCFLQNTVPSNGY